MILHAGLFLFEGIKPVGIGPTAALPGTHSDPAGTPTSDIVTFASLVAATDYPL